MNNDNIDKIYVIEDGEFNDYVNIHIERFLRELFLNFEKAFSQYEIEMPENIKNNISTQQRNLQTEFYYNCFLQSLSHFMNRAVEGSTKDAWFSVVEYFKYGINSLFVDLEKQLLNEGGKLE